MPNPTRIFLIVLAGSALLVAAHFGLDALLSEGIRPQEVSKSGLVASCYAPAGQIGRPAVLLLGGGAWGDY